MVNFNTDSFNPEAYRKTNEHQAVVKFVEASRKLRMESEHDSETGEVEGATNVYKEAKAELDALFKGHENNFSRGDHTLISQFTWKNLEAQVPDIDDILDVSDSDITASDVKRAYEELEKELSDQNSSFLTGKKVTDQTEKK